jgi:hypothetical protein
MLCLVVQNVGRKDDLKGDVARGERRDEVLPTPRRGCGVCGSRLGAPSQPPRLRPARPALRNEGFRRLSLPADSLRGAYGEEARP